MGYYLHVGLTKQMRTAQTVGYRGAAWASTFLTLTRADATTQQPAISAGCFSFGKHDDYHAVY